MTDTANKIQVGAERLLPALESCGRPLVFTNGCFDILHRGHVTYLEQAAGLGSTLLVAVNSDRSVRQLNKGPGRPYNSLEDRMHVLAALSCVDLVTCFDDANPLALIMSTRPDHLVKGGDWLPENIVGSEFVRSYGGGVHAIPVQFQRSTTDLIHRIQSEPES